MLKVKDRMASSFETMSNDVTALDVARLLTEKRIGSVFIKRDGEIVGIITETDIIRKVSALEKNPAKVGVESIMSTNVLKVDLNDTIVDACDMMDKYHTRHLAVTEGGKIVGIVSVRDLIRAEFNDGEGW